MATLFAAVFAYLGAEMALSSQPHPTHWAVAILFAALGFAGGEVLHRVKEPF